MYSVVLATMLATAPAAPAWGWHGGCHGCYGCCGCYGCYGCYGCGGCYGCYGCGGCYGCYGCYGCHGCCGYSCYGCYGCSGCYGCYGCHGCCGAVVVASPVVIKQVYVVPSTGKPMEKLGNPMKDEKETSATVTVKAPLDVRVKFNGQLARRSAEEESFATPALEKGQKYSYQVVAEAERDGKTVTLTKKVSVKAGEQSMVDFSELAVSTTAKT